MWKLGECSVPGCTEPRHNPAKDFTKCIEHTWDDLPGTRFVLDPIRNCDEPGCRVRFTDCTDETRTKCVWHARGEEPPPPQVIEMPEEPEQAPSAPKRTRRRRRKSTKVKQPPLIDFDLV